MQAHLRTSQGMPLKDVQDADKSSEFIDARVQIDSQVSKPSCNILTSKTFPVYQNINKSGLGVVLGKTKENQIVHASAYTCGMHMKQGIHIDTQVGKPCCNTLTSVTLPVCQNNNKSEWE